jgi:two-component system, response regulator PdtaR
MDGTGPAVCGKYVDRLLDISRAIASEYLLDDLLKLVVLVAAKYVGVDICSLWLVDSAKGDELRLAATQALEKEYVENRTLKMGEGVVGRVALLKKAMAVENVLEEPCFKEKKMAERLSLVSMLSVPMLGEKNGILGVMTCFTCAPHRFAESEIALFQSVADRASVVVRSAERMVSARVIEEELETLKKIEQAKRIVMERKKLEDGTAFGWLQKASADSCKSMRETAEAVLLAHRS